MVPTYGTMFKTSFMVFFHSLSRHSHGFHYRSLAPLQWRTISSTNQLVQPWMDPSKGGFNSNKYKPVGKPTPQASTFDDKRKVFTGSKMESFSSHVFKAGRLKRETMPTPERFSFSDFADEIQKARHSKRNSNILVRGEPLQDVLMKQEKIYRYFADFFKTREKHEKIDKEKAAISCYCSVVEVNDALLKFYLARKAVTELQSVRALEGPKSLPINKAEGRAFIVEQIPLMGRCPCGSDSSFNLCCGKRTGRNKRMVGIRYCPAFYEEK